MMDKTAENKAQTWKKPVVGALIGAVVGAGSVAGLMTLAGGTLLDAMGGSRVALAGVGVIYLLIAAFVGFGVVAPQMGAKVLNVADAEELREERANLSSSALFMGAFGATLILLALARGPEFAEGVVAPQLAMAALLLLTVGGGAMSWRWSSQMDELNRQLGLEGGAWAFSLSAVVLILWAAADSLGWNVRLTPLDVISVTSIMLLVGSFVAIGRRGMMVR